MKKSYTILIAEDEENNFSLVKYIFEKEGHKVLWAKNGAEAVNFIMDSDKGDIDLVIMDIKMPIMNGYEATIKIKEVRNDIPVLALTAYAFAEDRRLSMEAGCNDFITKPVKRAKLLETSYKLIQENED
jgi:CheY-like chemotaxis protein